MTRLTVTEEIEEAIAESGGSVRGALNIALADRDVAMTLLKTEQERNAALSIALEAVNTILSIGLSPETTIRAIDKIVRKH